MSLAVLVAVVAGGLSRAQAGSASSRLGVSVTVVRACWVTVDAADGGDSLPQVSVACGKGATASVALERRVLAADGSAVLAQPDHADHAQPDHAAGRQLVTVPSAEPTDADEVMVATIMF